MLFRAIANAVEIENLIAEKEDPANYTNIAAIVKVLMAEKALENTLLYGDMPYSEAGRGFLSPDGFRPVYDSQQTIFETAINDLEHKITDAINAINNDL